MSDTVDRVRARLGDNANVWLVPVVILLGLLYPFVEEGLQNLPLIGDFMPTTGTLVVIIGFFCLQGGRREWDGFAHGSIVTRSWVMSSFSAYVLLGLAPWPILILGVFDMLGAISTAVILLGRRRATGVGTRTDRGSVLSDC